MPDVSIAITAKDSYSTAIKKMSAYTKAFSKDQDEMEAKLKRLNENQRSLQSQLKTSGDRLKELHKAFDGMGSAIGDAMIEAEQANFDNLKRNLDLVKKGAKEAEKQMLQTGDAFSKLDNRANGATGVTADGNAAGVSAIFGSQLVKQLGQSLSQAGGAYIRSALGDDAGLMVESALGGVVSGAASGAALGSILPGIGTVLGGLIGAAVGGVSGTISGSTQIYENKDDYFKSYYNDIIDQQAQDRGSNIQSGSDIASTRESDLRALTSLLGGDEASAQVFQKSLIEIGRTPPFSYDTAVGLSKDMLGLGLTPYAATSRLNSLANAAAALDLSESDVSTIISTLESAQLAGKMETRVAKSLSKKGINVYEALAEEFNLSTDQVAAQLKDLDVDRAVSAIYNYMGSRFSGAAYRQGKTFEGSQSILESYEDDMNAAYGIGYNAERQKGLQANITAYEGPMGNAIQELNTITGSLTAYRENLQDQYKREAKSFLLTGAGLTDIWQKGQMDDLQGMRKEYNALHERYLAGDQEAGIKMAYLAEQADAMAQAAYDNSEWAKKELTAEEENTNAIRGLTTKLSEGILLRYQVDQSRTIGMGGGVDGAYDDPIFVADPVMGYEIGADGSISSMWDPPVDGSHASGLTRVPYDGYLAQLHEGERVLTAREVREADTAGGTGAKNLCINITMPGEVNIRGADDVDELAQALADKILLALEAGTF